jgi:ABC-type multidrug transport system ATPase subunit
MQIDLQNAGKRFNRDWIFRNLSFTFHSGNAYAVTGPNGSGKSTLLQVMAGAVNATEGTVQFSAHGGLCKPEDAYKQISVAAPYLELIEEMTAQEFLSFHQTFKPFIAGYNVASILGEIGLQHAAGKQIRYYSSGMKQRMKLAQAIFSNVPAVLLDEPCTNFDSAGYELYMQLVNKHCMGRLLIVCSNDINEYGFCTKRLNIADYKANVPAKAANIQ